MDNVIDFSTFKKNRELEKLLKDKKNSEDSIKVEVTPENLRKIAVSLEQIHMTHVKESHASKEILQDYELKVGLNTVDKKPVTLVWYPMR